MSRFLSTAVGLVLAVAPARADLDPELKQPYDLRVVLRFGDHRLLAGSGPGPSVFQERLRRELRDSLQAGLGDLARVEVHVLHKDSPLRADPVVREVEARGLAALDTLQTVNNAKTHFVQVDYADGGYEIQARQHDGYAGLASPVARRTRTTDRQLVARETVLLIDRDFGPVGTVASGQGSTVRLALKGGDVGVNLDPWVKKGDVFALTQIRKDGDRQVALRVQWALLQATEEPKDGACACQLFNRYEPAMPQGPGVLGYRALKLGAQEGPLRLRLVRNDRAEATANALAVWVSPSGFSGEPRERLTTDHYRPLQTEQAYNKVAFVQVFNNGARLARVPVPIVDDRIVVCPVSINPDAERRGNVAYDRERWVRRLYDNVLVQNALFKELQTLVGKSQEEAVTKAAFGLRYLKADIEERTAEMSSLRQSAAASGVANLDLSEGEQLLRELDARRTLLNSTVIKLDQIIKEENDPKRKVALALVEQARFLESQAEFAEALRLYDRALQSGLDVPLLKRQVEELRAAWQPRSPEHAKARDLVLTRWTRQASAAGMRPLLGEVRKALAVFKENKDLLGIQKLIKVNAEHAAALKQRQGQLSEDGGEDDKEREGIGEVSDALLKVTREALDFLNQSKG